MFLYGSLASDKAQLTFEPDDSQWTVNFINSLVNCDCVRALVICDSPLVTESKMGKIYSTYNAS